ncbi:MAG TPA: DUF4291 domain-containing protein [Flavobacteriales bacterium]|nr:DUF4291 domain-containing protein [Flavobacteriales bacterium]
MKLEKYTEQIKRLPVSGKQIIGRIEGENIIVYQAFNPNISRYAVENQKFGGEHYSFNRMSWIKPGFLWMMYRAGWASKEHQQHILAITLPMNHFKTILRNATITSFDLMMDERIFETHDEWKAELENTEVRLQWDPDHDPNGNKQNRKAIQLGMKGEILKKFATEWILEIEDITPFVKNEYEKVKAGLLNELDIPYEEVIVLEEAEINERLGIFNLKV